MAWLRSISGLCTQLLLLTFHNTLDLIWEIFYRSRRIIKMIIRSIYLSEPTGGKRDHRTISGAYFFQKLQFYRFWVLLVQYCYQPVWIFVKFSKLPWIKCSKRKVKKKINPASAQNIIQVIKNWILVSHLEINVTFIIQSLRSSIYSFKCYTFYNHKWDQAEEEGHL